MAPVDYDSHFSAEAKRRVPPTLRKLVAEFAGVTGTISMHAGIPPATAFPFKYFKAVTVDGTEIEINDPSKVQHPQRGSRPPLPSEHFIAEAGRPAGRNPAPFPPPSCSSTPVNSMPRSRLALGRSWAGSRST